MAAAPLALLLGLLGLLACAHAVDFIDVTFTSGIKNHGKWNFGYEFQMRRYECDAEVDLRRVCNHPRYPRVEALQISLSDISVPRISIIDQDTAKIQRSPKTIRPPGACFNPITVRVRAVCVPIMN